ncbi:MAG: fasciclin domain-containing protein [Chitinophagaceae bacterium]|nr:fasciclin domain-containing protein [Chitinophagaceae bacterium]
MNKLKLFFQGGTLLILLFAACRKQEFMPPPEGAKVPEADTVKITLKEALAASPAKLFYQAWQRSGMDDRLRSLSDGKSMFTILAPGDAAMERAGLTLQTIQSMEVKDLDSLLMFYTLRERITVAQLEDKPDNYIAISLLSNPALKVPRFITGTPSLYESEPYFYRQHLQVKDGKTYVNGKVAGAGISVAAKDGYLWLLDQTVTKPVKTLLEVVEADGRFTMLLAILRYTDGQYNQIWKDATGSNNSRRNSTDKSFSKRFGWELSPPPRLQPRVPNLYKNTLLLPTDEAFRNAGFNSLADLQQFNIDRSLPRKILDRWGYPVMSGNFATDTLLDYHINWGNLLNGMTRDVSARSGTNAPFFYSNVMSNAVLGNYVVTGKWTGSNEEGLPDPNYYMPLDFSRDASGKILVKVKGSEAPAATVVDADIYSIMGPIHAIDHLLIPKGFKIK